VTNSKAVYCLAMFVILSLTAALAAMLGFVSPDSWNYIHLAQSLRLGQGCMVGGEYAAVFPCGYPMAIALMSPSTDIAAMVVSSKFANMVLLGSGFVLLAKEMRNILAATLIIINPITLLLYQFTWSENLFLFACCGAFFSIARMAREEKSHRYVTLLGFFLIVGCLSRYFFGPFAAVIFLATWLAYGHKVAIKALPAFVGAAVVFLANQKLNEIMTGYGTGMARIPAPETLLFLTAHFVKALVRDAIYVAAAAAVLIGLSFRHISLTDGGLKDGSAKSMYVLLAVSGAGYLLLAYLLRTRTQYDLYGPRTIGYGVVFLFSAFAGYIFHMKSDRFFPVFALLAGGLFSAVFSQGSLIPRQLMAVVDGTQIPMAQAVAKYRSAPIAAQVVFAFSVPSPGPNIAPRPSLYYGEGVKVISPRTAPYSEPETLIAFKEKVVTYAAARCQFDFTPFPTLESFQSYLDQSYAVDLKFTTSLLRPDKVNIPVFDPELNAYLGQVFQSGRYVPCRDILKG